ncbi:unnamed protein product [Closterium sp. Yama58-4]|nr:unnamed protein product [Closterium sp. Yama58-4]
MQQLSPTILNTPTSFLDPHYVQEGQPISLTYKDERWQKTIRYFLTRHGQHITSLNLFFTDIQQLPSLHPLIACCSPALSSFSIKLRGFVDGYEEQEYNDWTLDFLKGCSHLQHLKLGRGMWNLDESCANAAWVRSLRCLTLKHLDRRYRNYDFLESITPQLHDNELKLKLTVPPSLKSLSVMAKWLVLSCKSTAPLALDHLLLYGQERLVISSLRIASARAVYLYGPASDEDSSCPGLSYQLPLEWQHVPRGISGFSWTKWLRTIAQNVEVLVVRHGIPIEEVDLEWRSLRSLGIVVHVEGPHNKEWEATVENYRAFMEDGDYEDELDECSFGYNDEFDDDEARINLPSIRAPNLQFLFFPSRKACDAATLAALRQDYPALALYCVVDRSFYWERKGQSVSHGPLEHVRQAKSGVLRHSVVNGPLDHILVSIGTPGNSLVGGWVVSASLLTAACGALSAGWLADSVGRRTTFLLLALPLALGSALSATASSVPQMLVGRALTGLAFGVISCVVPVYISEIAPASVRGRLGSLNQLAICVGILAALLAGLPLAANPAWYTSCTALHFLRLFAFHFLPHAIRWKPFQPAVVTKVDAQTSFRQLSHKGMLWAPESPRWLAKACCGRLRAPDGSPRSDEAGRQLKRLLGPSQAAAAAAELSSSSSSSAPQPAASAKGAGGAAAVDGLEQAEAGVARKRADEAPAVSFFTLFSKRYRKVVLLGMALFAVQQFAGINAIIYYSSSVFRSAGIQSDVAASALVGLANVLGTAVSLNLVDKQGRKSLLMGSFTGMGCSMLLLALTLSFPPLQPIAAPLSVLGTVAYVLAFAMGAGPVPALLLPEIFPSNIRASAVAAALTTHWLCNFVIGLSFLGFVKVVGVAAAYVGFAAVCFVGVVFVRACVVETKGRSLEEIERELIGSDA